MKLKEEHAVAIAEKAVFSLDRVGVSGQYHLPACESADQHEEAGFWEVEIGQKAVNDLEFVARAKENVGLA